MLFNSENYALLLLVSAPLYWLTHRQTLRVAILLVASIVFYASWDPRFLPLLLLATIATYAIIEFGIVRRALTGLKPRGWMIVIVASNLICLGIFKYTNFFGQLIFDGLDAATGDSGQEFSPYSIILPLGISFFTFQLISYAADIESGRAPAERNPFLVILFICFFPQLIAGPICRAQELMPQLKALQPFRFAALAQGALMLSAGYLVKAGFADNIAIYVDTAYADTAQIAPYDAFWATIGFALQIFFDFWGYSTMALGSAWLFGVMLPVNFNLPYIATSFQSFWRRWHMTLSFWLRDYLYLPLGGNQKGPVRTYFNLAAVMLLGGLWHGAALTFVIWGAIHGGALAVERLITRTIGKRIRLSRTAQWIAAVPRWLITMSIVLAAWVFFRAESLEEARRIFELIGQHLTALTVAGALTPPSEKQVGWFMAWGVIAMPLIHVLLSMGRNQSFYQHSQLWRIVDNVEQAGVPLQPARSLQVMKASIPIPDSVKLALAFWLFLLGYVLSSEKSTPFIYFQF